MHIRIPNETERDNTNLANRVCPLPAHRSAIKGVRIFRPNRESIIRTKRRPGKKQTVMEDPFAQVAQNQQTQQTAERTNKRTKREPHVDHAIEQQEQTHKLLCSAAAMLGRSHAIDIGMLNGWCWLVKVRG